MYSSVGTCLILKCHHLAVSIMKSNSVIIRTYTWKKYSFVWNGLRCGIGYTSQSTESALRCSWMVQCLICLNLSSSFFILVNIDDLGIGRSVHNLGRGEMRVFITPWSACSRHAGIRQQTPCLLSCFVYWPILQWSQIVWYVTLQLANAQRVCVVWCSGSFPHCHLPGPPMSTGLMSA